MTRRFHGSVLPAVMVAVGTVVGCSHQVAEPTDEQTGAASVAPTTTVSTTGTCPVVGSMAGIAVERTGTAPFSCSAVYVGSALVMGKTAAQEIERMKTLHYTCNPTFAAVLSARFGSAAAAISQPNARYCIYWDFSSNGGPRPTFSDLETAVRRELGSVGTITGVNALETTDPGAGQCPSCKGT